MPRGGKRAGAGRKPGTEEQAALDKRTNRALIRAAAQPYIERVVASQAESALGVSYMLLRDASGAYVRATDAAAVDEALKRLADGDNSAIKIYTKEPHTPAATLLLAYAADKPVEPVEVTGPEGGPLVVTWQR